MPRQRRGIRETDVPTEQARAQTPSRFPRQNGYQGRPQGRAGPAVTRSQAPERLTPAPPCGAARVFMQRLRHRADFLAVAAAAKVSTKALTTKAFIVQMRDRCDDDPARV